MQFSDTSTKQGIVEDIDFNCDTDSGTYPTAQKVRNVNSWYDRAITIILGADGGNGGGGNGQDDSTAGSAGLANTGSGGGGAGGSGTDTGYAGGSGLFIIKYTTADGSHTGGNATGTSGGFTWVKFTSSGTFAFTETSAFTPRQAMLI